MRVFSDTEVIRILLQEKARYAFYVGAGISVDAGVPTAAQICDEIRDQLLLYELPHPKDQGEIQAWENRRLNWADISLRYSTCLRAAYPAEAQRVEYFRNKLRSVAPSFNHHAIALLASSGYMKRRIITTNFDKLIESAFVRQAKTECQPIRTDAELKYVRDVPGRSYILKLHGDYDTYNVLNTSEETTTLSAGMIEAVRQTLQYSGLIVLGAAGYEKSVFSLFDQLDHKAEKENLLSFGLLWGVYVGGTRPATLPAEQELYDLIFKKIERNAIGRDIVMMMDRLGRKVGLAGFFPVWSATDFLFDLIQKIGSSDRLVAASAELYLDHEMRVTHLLSRAGLPEDAIRKHIEVLRNSRAMQQTREHSQQSEIFLVAESPAGNLELRLAYGDITSRSRMSDPEFQKMVRAVVSPEDTILTAGAGVAYALLEKAGTHAILGELAKFSPVEQGKVAVTSGGKLPVHFIFHAAAIKIQADGTASASQDDVTRTVIDIIEKARVLDIGCIWLPLMATGTGSLGAKQSLEGILKAIADCYQVVKKITVILVVRDEKTLGRAIAEDCVKSILGGVFSVRQS